MKLATLLGVCLRMIAAWTPERFWYDEAFSAILARLPLDRLISATAADVHPPLYYMLLRAWLLTPWARALEAWRGPELAARSLSLVASLIGLRLFHALIAGLPERPRRVAWWMACCMPGLIYYAGEARMYALLACFILGALLLLRYPWEDSPKGYGLAAGMGAGVLCLGAALTHNAGLLYCVVIAGAVLLWDKRRWPLISIAGGIALAGWCITWGASFWGQLQSTQANYWIWKPTLGTVAYMFYRAVFPSNRIPEWAAVPLLFVLAYLTTWAIVTRWPKRVWLWLAVGVPALAFGLAHVGMTSVLMHRILTPSLYAWCVLWAFALTREDVGRALRAMTAAVLVGVNAILLFQGRISTDEPLLNALHLQPGDVVYSANVMSVPLVLYDAAPLYIAPDGLADTIGSGLSTGTLAALGVQPVPLADVAFNRAWLIWMRQTGSPAPETDYIARVLAAYEHTSAVTFTAAQDVLQGDLWLLTP